MRIVFSNYDSPDNPFYGGGGAGAIHEVARRLAANHAVEIVTGRHRASRSGDVEGVTYRPVGPAWAGPKLGQLLFHFSLPLRVRRRTYDVWCESLTPPFSTACLQRFTARPVVALTQILGGKAMSRKYHLPFAALERAGLKTYRWAIATSAPLAAELRAANPTLRTAIIPNGVSGELVRLEPGRSERHVLFLGRLDVQQKGLDLLVRAVARAGSRLPWPLVIAGSGTAADEARLRRDLAELGLAEKVRMVGRVGGAQKHELLCQAAFLAMPSRFEASPLVMVEAFCYRLPVVAMAIPELADVPADCCLRTPPFDVAGYSDALVALAADPARRAAMGQAAKAYARRFDWDDLARQYAEFFVSADAGLVRSAPRD